MSGKMKTLNLTEEQFNLLQNALFFTERHVQDYDEGNEEWGGLIEGIDDLVNVVK